MEEAFYNISMYYLYKKVLEYAQIAPNDMESKIPYIEGCSNAYTYFVVFTTYVFYTCGKIQNS